ncbi:uncharacterized protein FA14DRAFT_180447 [Meira miltonrushii]|uniref:G-patch domain-containing protein n=1 Tax=Meira miltonrushii TaxID=1280837 RepID=A0A316VCU1_9BASI|nr:uncharacterized protein FA14DRAFT_180447 [Meira miltonrushii]PWN33811.1 hypothetical protein FA14DRAFT_180447 [Meira miltonrushii]
MSGQSTASSLYSGIFNLAKSDEASSNAGPSAQPIADASTESKPQSNPAEIADQKPSLDKSQGTWSAALRFTPRRNAALSKPKRAPIQSQLSTAFSNTDVHSDLAEGSSSKQAPQKQDEVASASKTPSVHSKAEAIKPSSHPRQLFGVQTHALNVEPVDSDRIPLPAVTQPPSLSLSVEEIEKDRALFRSRALKRGDIASHEQTDFVEDDGWNEEEDVNGFANTTEGRKARRKKRKRRASPGHHGGLAASLNMDADYDPRIPNDFIEFRKLLANRREAERSHRKRLTSGREEQGFDEEANYDDRSERGEGGRGWNRYDRSGKFAPPVAYASHSKGKQRDFEKMEDDDDDEKPYLSPPPSLPPGPPPGPPPNIPSPAVTGEDAYQRRLAMSQATSGEEAYQRRLAMSQGSMSEYGPSSSHDHKGNRSDDLASQTAAAAAIAARLLKTAPQEETQTLSSTASSIEDHDPSTFAERLMMKQGWRKGEALGAEGNKGILDPLLAQKVEEERARHHSKGQRGDNEGNDRAMKSARGTIINPQEEQKRQEERQKYGEASEVILLENMVASDEDIDDDLPGEIGEECEKHGKVERVFIWPAAHAKYSFTNSSLALSNSSGKPRIFVKFNGIAAAWKCLKGLDGRFFAGNTVRARYYPLQDFNRGNYDRLYD